MHHSAQYRIITDEYGEAYDVNDYRTFEFFVVVSTITPQAPMSFAAIDQCKIAIHASAIHDCHTRALKNKAGCISYIR
jgi:hypothetical protein